MNGKARGDASLAVTRRPTSFLFRGSAFRQIHTSVLVMLIVMKLESLVYSELLNLQYCIDRDPWNTRERICPFYPYHLSPNFVLAAFRVGMADFLMSKTSIAL